MVDFSHFRKTLLAISSPENEIRNSAEKEYEEITITNRLTLLVTVLSQNDGSMEEQQLAAVLLRRIITGSFEESFLALVPKDQAAVKHQIILSVQVEQNDIVRRKKVDCLSELSRKLFDNEGNNIWPEVLQFMFKCVNSNNIAHKEIPLHVFCQFPGIFGNQQSHYQEVIRQMLGQCMQMQEQAYIRSVGARATISFLLNNAGDSHLLRHFNDLIPGVLQAAEESAANDDDEVFKSLIELCEDAPKAIRAHIEPVLTVCLKVVSNTDREDSIRQLALETIVTIAETIPGLTRKQKGLIHPIIEQMLQMMIDLDCDDEALAEWSVADDAEEDDSDSNTVAGENAIDRLSCALGGKTILPHIMQTVPPLLRDTGDWRKRHAGLMAISAVGEGCHKYMEEILEQIVDAILPFFGDAHPRVRYAACNAIGQMCTDFAPTMQKQFYAKVVPALCSVFDDHANPRVQAHAGAAMVNFVEDCPKPVLAPYLDPLCSKLQVVLATKIDELVQTGAKLVLEQVTTTIAAVADTAEEQFIAYYDKFIPSLKYIIENAHSPELRMLRGKTIECISLIGLAVGSEKFMPDAEEIMQQLLRTQADIESWEDDDPQISYMISAWARMCKLLGQRFVEYLPVVMSPLMKAASIRPEVTMLDSQDAETIEEDDGWEFIKLGDQYYVFLCENCGLDKAACVFHEAEQSFGIKTAGLEEKATACQMLVCYARELKEGFVDYVEEVVKLMVPLLKFYFHDGVRASASEAIPLLLECAALRGEEYVNQIWTFISPNLLTAMKDEPDKEVLSTTMESLARCIELRGMGCFTLEQYQDLAGTLRDMLDQHFERAQERLEKRHDEDYDEQVEETLQDEDQDDTYILSKIADILHSLFGSHRSELFPLFDSLFPHYVKLLGPDRPWADRQWALCVFDDIVEYAGPESIKYKSAFAGPILAYLQDESPEVRQAAAYGVGVMAVNASQTYADVIKEALPRLKAVIEGDHGRGCQGQLPQDDVAPLENCISAVGKILRSSPSLIGSDGDVQQLLQLWLAWLPVTEDKEEAGHVYRYVCELIQSNNPVILGENNRNLPAVIALLADAAYGDALAEDKEVSKNLVSICKHIQVSAPTAWSEGLSLLSPPKQLALTNMLDAPAA